MSAKIDPYASGKLADNDPNFTVDFSIIVPKSNIPETLGPVNLSLDPIGRLVRRSFEKRFEIQEKSSDATWTVEIKNSSTATSAIIDFRDNIDDILMVLHYEISRAT